MKIAIINYSGNVGKTTIAAHLLAPRLKGYKILSIESINENASNISQAEFEQVKSDKFSKIMNEMLRNDDLILDVGASNVEDFMKGLVQFKSSFDYIDMFIIPITPKSKVQSESINTADYLLEIGVPVEKIKVIFNQADDDVNEVFEKTVNKLKKMGISINSNLVIAETDLFDALNIKKMNISQLFEKDYKAELKAIDKTAKNYDHIVDLTVMRINAEAINENLNTVFDNLGIVSNG
jgi:CO dehydrogenase nickel-insertion accessory protein CooC1